MHALATWMFRGLLGLVALIVSYVVYARVAWRDLPAAALDARYGAGSRTALVDGVPIRYRFDAIEGDPRPVVVLIHSHYLDMGMWDRWAAALASRFAVLRYDLTGHGLTGPDPAGVYTVDRDVALLEGLLAQLGIERAAVVGSSLGGNIAFTFAARQPQRVDALVLVNSGGLKRKEGRSGRQVPAWAGEVLRLVPPALLRRFLHWMAAGDSVIDAAQEERFIALWRREGNRQAEFERLRQFDAGQPDAVLGQVTAPTLVLWGERNPQLPVALAQEFAAKLTRASTVEVKTYPGAGHVLPLERPQAADDVVRFLERSRKAAPR